jgi:coenzyme F420-0:L-glutamate ligase/coenzyme F420-1:gamma-L-glutamate ligase
MSQPEGYQEFLRSRRSVRHFLHRPVPEEALERILETTTYAPSAHNRQPWRFVIIQSLEAKARLADQLGAAFRDDLLADGLPEAHAYPKIERSRRRILEAPLAIILCLDTAEIDIYPDERRQEAEHTMAVQSLALAGGTLLLAAHAEGLGGVWMCAPLFAPVAVRQALALPPEWVPQSMLLIGFPVDVPEIRPRKPVSEVSRFV